MPVVPQLSITFREYSSLKPLAPDYCLPGPIMPIRVIPWHRFFQPHWARLWVPLPILSTFLYFAGFCFPLVAGVSVDFSHCLLPRDFRDSFQDLPKSCLAAVAEENTVRRVGQGRGSQRTTCGFEMACSSFVSSWCVIVDVATNLRDQHC